MKKIEVYLLIRKARIAANEIAEKATTEVDEETDMTEQNQWLIIRDVLDGLESIMEKIDLADRVELR